MNLPDPLTPPDLDLRDFGYMPVEIGRLFGSQFHALATDAEWRAGVTIWLKSYHQVPGASVPDDDGSLARLAEFGRDVKGWRKVRTAALRGWVKCSDGRLYHRVVAEKALEGWLEKLTQRKSSGTGNAKRWATGFDPKETDEAISIAVGMLAALNPQSRSLSKRGRPQSRQHPTGTTSGVPPGQHRDNIGSPDRVPLGSQGKGREIDDDTKMRAGASLISAEAFEITTELEKACGFNLPEELPPGWCGCAMWVQKCLNEGWIGAVMVQSAGGVARRKKGGFIESFKYLEKPLAEAMAEHRAPLPYVEVRQPEKLTVIANGKPQTGNILPASDRLVDKIGSFDAGPSNPDEVRGGTGAANVRLLSKG
jgi:hypothetical protein